MSTAHKEVIIISAGFTGIGAAIKRKEQEFDFLLLKKVTEISGVWSNVKLARTLRRFNLASYSVEYRNPV